MTTKNIKNIGFLILCMGFIAIIIGNKTIAAQKGTDLEAMAAIVEKYEGYIFEWSLYTRERVDLPTTQAWLNKQAELEKQFPDMRWTVSVDGDAKSVTGYREHEFFSEKINLLTTDKKGHAASYLVYEVVGTLLNEEIAEQAKGQSDIRLKRLFAGKPFTFSCIKGTFKEELNEFIHHSLEGFLQDFQIEEQYSFQEKDFYSISAHSSLFEQSLSFTEQNTNMQLGLRTNTLGSGTTVVIGTPILTIEY